MTHILDNPIWNALSTGNKKLAFGSRKAKYLRRDVGLFAGLKTNSESEFVDLRAMIPDENIVVLFTPGEINIPDGWKVELNKDVPAMLELTALTNPGPFLAGTIEIGPYEGIFDGGNLVAMAGQRLRPDPYTEVSAVCTHPDHTGKGYAAKLVRSQIRNITAAHRIPILHVYPENTAACKLYKKLGFETRKQMRVYVLEKVSI